MWSGTEILCPPATYLTNSSWIAEQNKSTVCCWTHEENKRFENALADFDERTPDRWQKVANRIPGKTAEEVGRHYQELENDVSHIEAGLIPCPGYSPHQSFMLDWETNRFLDEFKHTYGGAGGAGGRRSGTRPSDQERKKGVPWTEDEHRRFLMGLKKYGKGDWRNISRNFVFSRTPTQVASHAQKYFIRLSSGGKDKRRSSIHDITTVNLPDNRPPSPPQPSALSVHSSSAIAPGTPDQFSVIVDSNQPNEASGVLDPKASQVHGNLFMQPSYGITHHGLKFEARNFMNQWGRQSMLFQL